MTRPEAVAALKIALPRCYGEKVLLSTETATALGIKAKSITKAEAQKIVDKESTDSDEDDSAEPETSGDAAPAKPSRRKSAKPADPPAETGATSDPLG